jgi:hypothetical protein
MRRPLLALLVALLAGAGAFGAIAVPQLPPARSAGAIRVHRSRDEASGAAMDSDTHPVLIPMVARDPVITDGVTVDVLETMCAPAPSEAGCLVGTGLQPAFSVTVRVTYDYDGALGPHPELTIGTLWTYGTCLINIGQFHSASIGEGNVVTTTVSTTMSDTGPYPGNPGCLAMPSVTDRVSGFEVCFVDLADITTRVCFESLYDREVRFTRS